MILYDDSSGMGSAGRAQRTVESLREARECVSLDEDTFAVRWLMSTTWDIWRRLSDRRRCERMASDLPSCEAARDFWTTRRAA